MKIIGITGPTGAGKTTALRELERLGGCVLDCDEVYHRLLAGDEPLRRALTARFGDLSGPGGCVDRKKLGAVVFDDPSALEDLNAITHRRVVEEVDRILALEAQAGRGAAAIDAIGLFESGLDRRCCATVAITAPPEVRVRRIMAREGISEDYARARVQAQRPEAFYTSRCGYTLHNSGPDPAAFARQARRLFASILSDCL